jgi:hypothetical protein
MPKPKLILDTNVAQTLLQPNYQPDLNRIVGRISSRFQVVVSPQTYLELLNSVCGGDEAHFEDHRNRLRLTVGRGNPEFLPFPVAFAVFKVLRLNSPTSPLDPGDFRQWLRVVLHAKDRIELFGGEVRLPNAPRRLRSGFDPNVHLRQHEAGIAQHRQFLEQIRDGTATLQPAEVWAAAIASMLSHQLNHQQATVLAAGLDAAYQYHRELCTSRY